MDLKEARGSGSAVVIICAITDWNHLRLVECSQVFVRDIWPVCMSFGKIVSKVNLYMLSRSGTQSSLLGAITNPKRSCALSVTYVSSLTYAHARRAHSKSPS